MLPPEPTASNKSEEDEDDNEEEEDEDEEEEEEEENDRKDDYVAAVCQYTTVLKETPPGFDDKKYEVNFMNMDKGTTDESVERNLGRKCSKSESMRVHVRHNSGSDRQRDKSSSERLIEYCEDEDEEEDEDGAHLAVSGKLAIHLDTGETSREFCLNRLEESSARTHTREDR